MAQTRNLRSPALAAQQAAILASADTIMQSTFASGSGYWAGDEGMEHRAFLNHSLDLAVTAAILSRDWSRARLLAAALNLGE